ncbi:TPA: hypothetical protein ACG3NF_001770 [Legionella pneumophila]|uniref:hypothetical protein n=1 Tax=Legionella pneumophila TaxID=446 RepID=UPI0004893616|nr:hypothetical protein [Legionella pneumophila]HAT9273149.1 hypothetical protein [Legionella pneumophila subsp. pneumophila]MCZ4723736.1 hypothetical protein [Legionella pneumophila]MCZ4728664.1 hypothetical protein [Legionella pneumophila]MCZ4733995.1 hypothetical protein [Legionella pneumophila]MDW8897916.1 hypothetical protein [Legionella pneumophila]
MLDLISNGFALRKKSPVVDPQEIRSESATDMLCPVMDSAISAESAEVMNRHEVDEYIQNDDENDCIVREQAWFGIDGIAETADITEIQVEQGIIAADLLRNECALSPEALMKTQVIKFVQSSCQGFSVSASYVLKHLLSNEDINDITDGNTPMETLKLHIELWMAKGMPHYSGKSD